MTVTLYNGNCVDILENIEENSIDMVLTDPPYNLGLFMKNRQTNLKQMRNNYFGSADWDNLEYDEWITNMEKFFTEVSRIIIKGHIFGR